MGAFRIDEIPLPENLHDDPGAADFLATVEVRNLCEELGYGTPDVRVSAARLLTSWRDPYSPHRLFVARVDGRVVARAMHETALEGDADTSWADVRVHPDHRGRGIGTALADVVEAVAREAGRRQVIAYIVSPDAPGKRLAAPTGSGSIPADNPEVRFLLARGYRLEQVVRASRLPLPVDPDAVGRPEPGADYAVRSWSGPTPPRWRDDIATLRTRMSTDAPQGELGEPEDVWTAERVAERDTAEASDDAVTLTSAVEHLPSGRLVGFTELSVPGDTLRPVDQEDTLVLREHRGHRLGMLLKLANLDVLQARHPGHPSITTWNADENRQMLAVNEAIGFVPMGYEGAWKLTL